MCSPEVLYIGVLQPVVSDLHHQHNNWGLQMDVASLILLRLPDGTTAAAISSLPQSLHMFLLSVDLPTFSAPSTMIFFYCLSIGESSGSTSAERYRKCNLACSRLLWPPAVSLVESLCTAFHGRGVSYHLGLLAFSCSGLWGIVYTCCMVVVWGRLSVLYQHVSRPTWTLSLKCRMLHPYIYSLK